MHKEWNVFICLRCFGEMSRLVLLFKEKRWGIELHDAIELPRNKLRFNPHSTPDYLECAPNYVISCLSLAH